MYLNRYRRQLLFKPNFESLKQLTFNVSDTSGAIYLEHNGHAENIISPNYPSDYTNNAFAQWWFIAPQGSVITVHFNYFLLEDDCCDYVRIYSGNTSQYGDAQQEGELFGPEVPADVVNYASYLWIEFTSDGDGSYSGFNATVTAANALGKSRFSN